MRLRALAAPAALAACLAAPRPARAEEERLAPAPGYVRLQGTLAFGGGLRFNNPYRLRTFLGGAAESVSATAPYADVGVAFALGKPGLQHGAALRASFGLVGVPEQALSLSYLMLVEPSPRWLVSARVGPSLLLSPEPNLGGELALGATLKLSAHVGLFAELVGNLYVGASTFDVPSPTYPILSLQAGAMVDWERLP